MDGKCQERQKLKKWEQREKVSSFSLRAQGRLLGVVLKG